MADPKFLAVLVPLLLGAGALLYRLGRRSVQGAVSEDIRQLQVDLVTAHATPDPADDEAVEAKIRAKQRLKAALDALPDQL